MIDLFNTKEGAVFCKIKEETLTKLARTGIVKSSKPNGKHRYYRREDLIAYLTGEGKHDVK